MGFEGFWGKGWKKRRMENGKGGKGKEGGRNGMAL